MGKATGFMEYERLEEGYAPVTQTRLKNYKEFVIGLKVDDAKVQAARCMDCGTPFCNSGCPVNNVIPDFNDLVYANQWKHASTVLHSTNNFPEFTGRICPAPCEAACVLNVNDDRGRHQVDRACDRRPRMGRRLGRAAEVAGVKHGSGRIADRRIRPGGHWRRRSSWRVPVTT